MTIRIFLDAGHGGKDSGAVGNGLQEKDIVFDLSRRIEKLLLDYKGVEVMQTRTTDVFLELSQRTAKANAWNANVFLSLHINASTNAAAKGFETFIYNGTVGAETVAFQNVIHQEIVKQITGQANDRGKNRANFHVLRESNMPAVLTECLFISNAGDAALLKNSSFLDKLALGHVLGLEKFFGLERTARPPTESPVSDELFQVIAGTFQSRDNADKLVAQLKADGYNAYVNKK